MAVVRRPEPLEADLLLRRQVITLRTGSVGPHSQARSAWRAAGSQRREMRQLKADKAEGLSTSQGLPLDSPIGRC